MTAAWLVPLAVGIVFYLSETGFAVAFGLLLVSGGWEFRRLAAVHDNPSGWILVGGVALIILVLFLERSRWLSAGTWLLGGICLAWPVMLLRLRGFRASRTPDTGFRVQSVACALVALSGAWVALVWIRHQPQGSWWILCLLLIIWSADTGAYFTGRAIGKRKLAPSLSPGKTLAGLNGGLIAAGLVGWAAAGWLPTRAGWGPYWLLLAIVVALLSAGGDLFISLHKRITGSKDSGKLFPGHGGILDRLDSVLAGAPFFALGLALADGW